MDKNVQYYAVCKLHLKGKNGRNVYAMCMREQFVINKNLNEFVDKAELKEGQLFFFFF